MTSINIVFITSEVKVKRTTFVKNGFRSFIHRAFICNVLIAISEYKNPIDFGLTRLTVKVTVVTFVKTM